MNTVAVSTVWDLPAHLEGYSLGRGSDRLTLGEIASTEKLGQSFANKFHWGVSAHDGVWEVEAVEALGHLVGRLAAPLTVTDEACARSPQTRWAYQRKVTDQSVTVAAGMLVSALVEREDLPGEVWVPLLTSFGKALASLPGETSTAAIWKQLATGIRQPAVPASLLGTLWRTLYLSNPSIDRRVPGSTRLASRLVENFLANPNLPVVVGARIVGAGPAYYRKFMENAVREYPELDGLPRQMMWDVVVSQPVPDVWFSDEYALGREFSVLVPPARSEGVF